MSALADSIPIAATTEATDRRRRIIAIVGASSGNLVEWYDFYAYAFTSIYFASAFFPSGDATSQLLEPISKSPEQDNEAGELNKSQEVLGVVLPADEDSALPLDPGEEALNDPAAHIAG